MSDFTEHSDSQKDFKYWEGHSLICPDIPADETFSLSNDESRPLASFYQFQIDRCDPTARKDCKSETENDAKILEIQVAMWEHHSRIDYSNMTDNPLFKT